jgi:regulator of cell morphogenesis and NO signaling
MGARMTTIERSTTLAALVDDRPELAPLLERLELDYCCGGARSLETACTAAALDVDETARELAEFAGVSVPAPWRDLGPGPLCDHIESTHHVYLTAALPRLDALVDRVADVHGERHPELNEVQRSFRELRADLEPHLMKEERILFPMIRTLETTDEAPEFHCGSVRNPIGVMCAEHDRAGELLAELRTLTGGWTVPGDGCASYSLLYHGLAELEADTHLHIHKENNILFPAAVRTESDQQERHTR